MPTDYEILAKQFGGAVGQKKEGSNVDYTSLAQKFGGSVATQPTKTEAPDMSRVNQPFSAEDAKRFYKQDYSKIAEQHGVVAVQTPQEKILQATIAEGYTPEQAQRRQHEYDYFVKQGGSPKRGEEFAMSLQFKEAQKKVLTEEEKSEVFKSAKTYYSDMLKNRKQDPYFNPTGTPSSYQLENLELVTDEAAKRFVERYAYGREHGWSASESEGFAGSEQLEVAAKVNAVIGSTWQSAAGWVAKNLGVHHPYEKVVNPYFESDEEVRHDEFIKHMDLSWSDRVAEKSRWKGWLAKGAVGLDNGLGDLVGSLTSAPNVLLMLGSEGTSALGASGVEAPVAVTKTVRTVSKLANAGFMYQMANGTVQDVEQTVEAAKKGDGAEAITFAVSGLGSAWMVKMGVDHARAEHSVREVLNRHSAEMFEGKRFGDLKTPEQAVVLDRAMSNDPMFQQLEGISEKQAKRNLDRIKYRQGVAVQQAWNPKAAERAIRKIHADRTEESLRQYDSAVRESIRKAVEENRKAEVVKSEKIISDNEAAKQKNAKVREDRENETPRPQATEVIPKTVVDGEEVYGPVTRLEHEAHIGVEPVGSGFGVYIRDAEDGTKQYLNSAGFFGSEESAASVEDEESAKTLAQIQALKTTVAEDAEKESHLENVTKQLIDKEIDARHAQDMTGIGGDERIPDEHDTARGEGVEGPFANGRKQFNRDFDEGYEKTGRPLEEKDATLAQAEASAWDLTNENLNMLTRSGDRIVDRRGGVWELGADGLLHGPNGREVPLTKNGLYSNQAMNMAAYGRIHYGEMTREERLSREERERDAQRAVASIDQELLATGAEPISEEKLARVRDYSNRRRQSRAERTEPQEGEQGPAPDTEQSLINLLSQVGDAGWASNPEYAAGRLQEEADREGVPVEALVRHKLSGSEDPLARIAQLQPGNTIQDANWKGRTWTVSERKNGDLYLASGGAQHDLNPLNPSDVVRRIVGKGDSITFNKPEQLEEAASKPVWVENNRQATQEVKDRAESPVPEPRTEEEAKGNVQAAEGRQESSVSEVVRATAEAFDVNAGTTEQDIDKRVQAAKEATDTLHRAVQQTADAAGKAAGKSDYPRGGGIYIVARGNPTEIIKGTESFPAHYVLVDAEAPITSHKWNGNKLEENEEYVPKGMQYRAFDESRTQEILGEAQPENFNPRLYYDLTQGPELGPTILNTNGEVPGGNTRRLRELKYIENISRIADPDKREAAITLFKDRVRKFASRVGIDRVPEDDRFYTVARELDKPIETMEEAARIGRLFNDRSSAQVSENVEALSNGKLLSEADARERSDGKDGILRDIAKRIAGNDISSVRSAIDDDPYWFAKVAKDYFHVPSTENAAWFDSVGEDATLNKAGKDKFIYALIGSHISDVNSVRLISGTDAESSLTKAIGTVTALRAYPDRDLTEKVTEAVAAAAKTRRFRSERYKPIAAWNLVYTNDTFNGFGVDKPAEPSRVTQAIYVALLDSKTTRLNGALKDMIAGEPGMEMLFASKVEGQELHTPADYFNVAFRSELEKIAKSHGKSFDLVTQTEFEAALQNRDLADEERIEEKKPQAEKNTYEDLREELRQARQEQEAAIHLANVARQRGAGIEEADQRVRKATEKASEARKAAIAAHQDSEIPKFGIEPPPESKAAQEKGIKPPPKTRSEKEAAKDGLLNQVREQGFVDRRGLKEFLEADPVTRENANWTMKNFQWVAKAIWEHEKPEGVEGKDALDWLLERKKILGSVERDNYHERGRGRTEWDEVGRAHVYLHKDADATTAVHELWHAFLPLLSEEDLRALNTIKGKTKAIWDGKSRADLTGKAFDEFSERALGGIEKYYRDEEPSDFSAETGKVLAKLKEMFQQVYKKWREDPLRPFRLTEKSKETLDRIFHVEGVERVTGIDRADEFRTEAEAAEKAKKRIKKPSEAADPIIEIAKDYGVSGKPEKSVSGPIEDMEGVPIRVEKSTAFVLDSYDAAVALYDAVAKRIVEKTEKRTDGVDIVRMKGGKYAVRVNGGPLYQELPSESRGEMGARLKNLKKDLAALPRNKILDKQFLQMQVEDLENRIRAEYGTEEREPKTSPELAHKVMEERKNERANRVREGTHEAAGIQRPPTVDRVSGKAELGMPRHDGASGSSSIRGLGVDRVEAISMLPLRETNDPVVGKTADDAPDTEESWKKRLTTAGMSEESPLPIWSLTPRTARILDDDKFPGQSPTVQIAMSALQRGDGAVVGSATGTGKTWTAMAIVSEFGREREAGDKPLTLYMTRNRPLLEKTADEPAKSFGIDLILDTPKFGIKNGTYGVSYQAALRNPVYQNIKWNLFVADEVDAARNWFKKSENKKGMSQGQMLMAIMQNSQKEFT